MEKDQPQDNQLSLDKVEQLTLKSLYLELTVLQKEYRNGQQEVLAQFDKRDDVIELRRKIENVSGEFNTELERIHNVHNTSVETHVYNYDKGCLEQRDKKRTGEEKERGKPQGGQK